MKAIKLNIEAFYIWLAGGSAEAADRYCMDRRTASRAITEAKMGVEGVWGSHGEGLQCGFHLLVLAGGGLGVYHSSLHVL